MSVAAQNDRFVRLQRLFAVRHLYLKDYAGLQKSVRLRGRVGSGRGACRDVPGRDCAAVGMSIPRSGKRSRAA